MGLQRWALGGASDDRSQRVQQELLGVLWLPHQARGREIMYRCGFNVGYGGHMVSPIQFPFYVLSSLQTTSVQLWCAVPLSSPSVELMDKIGTTVGCSYSLPSKGFIGAGSLPPFKKWKDDKEVPLIYCPRLWNSDAKFTGWW